MNRTIAIGIILACFILISNTIAITPPIDVAYHIQNGFDSNGNLKPQFQSKIDFVNQAIDHRIPNWLLQPRELRLNLNVTDSPTSNTRFGITVQNIQIESIKAKSLLRPNATITTTIPTINAIANSTTPLAELKKHIRNRTLQIETRDFILLTALWLFMH